MLFLDGDGAGPANHVAIVSNAQPAYAPPGHALVCANVVSTAGKLADTDDLEDTVRRQMLAWFGAEADDWTHLRTYRIRHALPADADDVAPAGAIVEHTDVLVCGDHCTNGSINGAMASGRRAAESLLDR